MFTRFTASARRVMQRAFREAKRWQHDFVGTDHLLYGLLCDAEGPAVALLLALDARPELMLDKVELSLQRHEAGMAMEQFPLSPASRRAFRCAAEEAEQFRHQMIGPEHLLLGLLRENECVAFQILAAHGVTWNAVRDAVARMPRDLSPEAQIQPDDGQRVPIGDNPSAADLKAWIAPPITLEQEIGPTPTILPFTHLGGDGLHSAETQLRLTQLLLGAFIGYVFGYWLWGWPVGLAIGIVGFGVAVWRNVWIGVLAGALCGLFLSPLLRPHLRMPLDPMLLGMLGAFLGSFLGDWRISRIAPKDEHEPPEKASTQEAVEVRSGKKEYYR